MIMFPSLNFSILYKIMLIIQNDYTPLYAAAAKGFNDVVKSLIAANADVNCVCKVSC